MRIKTGILHKCILLAIGAVFVLATGCNTGSKPYSETLVLTVDGSKIYMDEMMYHVMLAAMQGELYASFVGNGEDYWNMKNEDGSTMREAMKNMALENAEKYQIFYELAGKEGYTLTEEEKAESRSKVDNILGNMGKEQIESVGLTGEKLIDIQDKIAIATKYYNNYVNSLDVDEAAIRTGFDPSDYKQYDIEYIYAKKEDRDSLAALLGKAKKAEDITALAGNTDFNSGRLSFLAGENTFGEETNLEDAILAMAAGEVSDMIETVKGYYIIKLTDNTSTEKYDSAVKQAIDNAEEEAFDTAYKALKKEHKIEIKEHVWKQIDIDKTIINSLNNVKDFNPIR